MSLAEFSLLDYSCKYLDQTEKSGWFMDVTRPGFEHVREQLGVKSILLYLTVDCLNSHSTLPVYYVIFLSFIRHNIDLIYDFTTNNH